MSPVSDTVILCKQFRSRSGWTEHRSIIWIQTVGHSDSVPERVGFFLKVNFEKVSRRQQKHEKLPSMQRIKSNLLKIYFSGDKNILILHLSCRTSDLQFLLVLQTHSPSFKRIYNKEHKGVICNLTSSSNSFQSTRPTGREMWGELLVLSRFHS